jgi:hypothetical protein
VTSAVRGWLRGDLADVVQVVPRQRPRTVPGTAQTDIRAPLARWAAQLTRRRAAVLARRYLLVALVIALVPALIVLALGASRPFWVLALLVLVPAAAVAALVQRTSQARAARLLDESLGLHDQIGTALELQAGGVPAAGLAGMVLDEAGVSLARSFASARVQARRAPGEWAWLALAVCALGVLLAVPRHHGGTPGTGGGAASASAARAGTPPQQRSGSATPGHTVAATSPDTTSTPSVQQVPLTGGAKAAYGVQASRTTGQKAPASVNGAGTVQGHTKAGLSVSGGKGAGGSQSGQTQAAGANAAAGTGGTKTGTSGSTAAGKSGGSAKASTGAQGSHSGVTSTTPGKAAGAAQGSQKGHGTGGTPAGGTAGTGKAAAHAKLGLTPYGGTGTSTTGLPLQASYTPSASHISTTAAASQTANGNGGGGPDGASGHPGSAAASQSGSGTDFSVIPPTANASSSDGDLVQNYFGTTNQLSFKGW